MTLTAALMWSIGRALLVTLVAVPLSKSVQQLVTAQRSGSLPQRLLTVAALLPLFVPELLTGFTWRLASAKLVHSTLATEALYAALLLCRIVALQFAVRLMLPGSPVSTEALHLWSMMPRRRTSLHWWKSWWRLKIFGPWRVPAIAFLAGMLLAFQDFETAALLQIDRHPVAWTVWLFDAHALGEPLSRALRFTVPAAAVQLLLIVPGLSLLVHGGRLQTAQQAVRQSSQSTAAATTGVGAITVTLTIGTTVVWPLLGNVPDAALGLLRLWQKGTLLPLSVQILRSAGEAFLAAGFALLAAYGLQSQRVHRKAWLTGRSAVALLPGLIGPLVTGLVLLSAFQLPILRPVYDTILPMLCSHVLMLLPRAVLLVAVLQVLAPAVARHSAELLRTARSPTVQQASNHLIWILQTRRWLLALAILTHWCFWDVTTASLLRPVQFEPIVIRLYNEMHYGRTESLVAMSGLSLLLPWTLTLVALQLCRRWN